MTKFSYVSMTVFVFLMKAQRIWLTALAMLIAVTGAHAETEFWQIRTNKTDFSYYELGRHIPQRSGRRPYSTARFVVAPDIGLPMAINPRNGEHMYCNTQVYGLGGFHAPSGPGTPTGDVNSEKSYYFPWTSNMCEKRGRQGDKAACGTIYEEHLGQDCRPPNPSRTAQYFATAVDGGRVDWVGSPAGVRVNNNSFIWTYLHLEDRLVRRNDPIAKGQKLGKVWLHGSGAIHLHITVRFKDADGYKQYDPLPSLIVAYQKALGNPVTIHPDGTLARDDRFEIFENATVSCAGALQNPVLPAANTFTFASLWCLNDSIVGLTKDGGKRQFIYYKPATAELAEAVKDEPIVFEGIAKPAAYEGITRHYSVRCGNRTYAAAGPTSANAQTVEVKGERDSFPDPASCDAVKVPETLTFNYFSPAPPSGTAGSTPPTGGTGGTPLPDFDTAQPVQKLGECANVSLSATLPSAQNSDIESYWFYNCSIVGLLKAQQSALNERRFVYVRPKTALSNGPSRDAVIFDGSAAAQNYIGRAIHYNAACGDQRYNVTGVADASSLAVTLQGMRTTRNSACATTGTSVECLRFTYAGKTLEAAFLAPLRKEACTAPGPIASPSPGITEPRATVDPTCTPFSICTFNYAALTPRAEPRDYATKGFAYMAAWPGLIINLGIRDSQQNPEGGGRGFVIPAFSHRVSGAALWWYWMRKRANGLQGYDPAGTVTFKTLAKHYAGIEDLNHPKVKTYWTAYRAHSVHYFGRHIEPDDALSLADPDVRWNLARVMFHHEAGAKFSDIDSETFQNSIRLAEDVISGKIIDLDDYR